MELLDLKVGGIVIGTLLVIWGVGYMVREGCKDWREQRDLKKEVDNTNRAFHAKYRWEPDMRTVRIKGSGYAKMACLTTITTKTIIY